MKTKEGVSINDMKDGRRHILLSALQLDGDEEMTSRKTLGRGHIYMNR